MTPRGVLGWSIRIGSNGEFESWVVPALVRLGGRATGTSSNIARLNYQTTRFTLYDSRGPLCINSLFPGRFFSFPRIVLHICTRANTILLRSNIRTVPVQHNSYTVLLDRKVGICTCTRSMMVHKGYSDNFDITHNFPIPPYFDMNVPYFVP